MTPPKRAASRYHDTTPGHLKAQAMLLGAKLHKLYGEQLWGVALNSHWQTKFHDTPEAAIKEFMSLREHEIKPITS
jgi:hypothetical protein